MRGYIIPNPGKENAKACALLVAEAMEQAGIEPVLPLALREEYPIPGARFLPREEGLSSSDLIVAIGGDGTILHAARDAVEYDLPILGVNAGRVGFLTSIEQEEIDRIKKLAGREYRVEERMLIEAKTDGQSLWAANDFVLDRGGNSRIVDVEILCDGKPLYTIRGDGVILSTPTGSTAYALSAGGPVVDPAVQSIGLTPICPYTLFSRTILFSAACQLTLRPKQVNNDSPLVLSADGRPGLQIPLGHEITINRSQRVLKLIRFEDKSFYDVLNQKMMWGGAHP